MIFFQEMYCDMKDGGLWKCYKTYNKVGCWIKSLILLYGSQSLSNYHIHFKKLNDWCLPDFIIFIPQKRAVTDIFVGTSFTPRLLMIIMCM